jgi:hypothetical protein
MARRQYKTGIAGETANGALADERHADFSLPRIG